MNWEVVIGLEVHAQLTTKSKIFSGASTRFGEPANSQASLVDLAMPGTLPVLNHDAVMKACLFGLAIDAVVAERSVFDRKNYFYPDLPKGYQISQLAHPIVEKGHLDIDLEDGTRKRIGITRAHLEEDAGKSLHEDYQGLSGIDLNRAGTPLLEIVSEPDLRSAKEAVAYLKKLHALVMWLGICDGNMQEGSFRCDANVSIRKQGDPLGTRAEIKNVNSFKNVEAAIQYEVMRQIDCLENGQSIIQETRLYDADRNETRSMRSKEEANDYRYFPDPDLLPVVIDPKKLADLRAQLPELPEACKKRLESVYGLSDYDAQLLTTTREYSQYFEQVVHFGAEPKLAANWINGVLQSTLNKYHIVIDNTQVSSEQLAGLIKRISDQTISDKLAKDIFEDLWNGAASADEVIAKKGLQQINDLDALNAWVEEVFTKYPTQVAQLKDGNQRIIGFLVGQVMKLSAGKANPAVINTMIQKHLVNS